MAALPMPLRLAPDAATPLLRGTFRADIAAPLPSPLQLDIGQLAITDATGIMSQVNGQLLLSGTPAALSGALATAGLARSAGLAVVFGARRLTTSGSSRFGLASSAAIPNAPYAGLTLTPATTPTIVTSGSTVANFGEVIGTGFNYWEAAFVLRAAGFFTLVRESASSPWVLTFVSALGTSAVWPHVSAAASVAQSFAVRNLRAIQLGGPWAANDYALAVGRIATTAADDTLACDPFGIYEHTITAATGVTQDFSFRYASDNDRWLVRLDQGAGTVKIVEVVGGVETVRGAGTATLTQANGTAYRVMVQVRPAATAGQDTISVGTQTGAASEVFKDTYTGAATGRNTGLLKVSRAGANLIAWPRGVPLLEAA